MKRAFLVFLVIYTLTVIAISVARAETPTSYVSQDGQFTLYFLDPLPIMALCWQDDYVGGYYFINGNTLHMNLVGVELQFEIIDRDTLRYRGVYFYRKGGDSHAKGLR